jgi:isopenicillin N synthase-like dioxygenase
VAFGTARVAAGHSRLDRAAASVASGLARSLAESLGLRRDSFDDAFNPDPHLLVKLIHYPGREDGDRQHSATVIHGDVLP